MVAMLIGCGLRRAELLALNLESIQRREDHKAAPPLSHNVAAQSGTLTPTGGRHDLPPACFTVRLIGMARLRSECFRRGGSRFGILNHRIDVDLQNISPLGHVLREERQVARLDEMPAES